MKRADDFRKFIADSRSMEESICCLPELPEGCDISYLKAVDDMRPVADNPYEKSDIRDSGLKIWDSVYCPFPNSVSVDPMAQKDIATLRSINSEWESTKASLGMLGRPDGVHYLRPKGAYIMDLMNDDIRMIQGAHILTHREECHVDDDYTFGSMSNLFFRNLVKIFAARKYKLVINTHPKNGDEDSFGRYGIEIFGSTSIRSPTLQAAISGNNCRLRHDKSVVALLGAVMVESHPQQSLKDMLWKESDKWSGLPSIVALAGWECVDYITHANRIELSDGQYYAIPCSDLQEMKDFDSLLKVANDSIGEIEHSGSLMTVDEWFNSEDFKLGLGVTPQLPCPECIRLNPRAEGFVPKPRHAKPKIPFSKLADTTKQEMIEWRDYVTFIRNCISIGRKATAYASGSVTSMKKRNTSYKKKSEMIHSLECLEKRYIRKLNGGFVSEAQAIETEIKKLKNKIETNYL